MPRVRISESEGGRDKPLVWGAPYQRKNPKPDFPGLTDARRLTPAQRHPPASGNLVRALFGAAKDLMCCKDEAASPSSRRRRGETDKGFVAACRTMLRRAARPDSDLCASAALYLSDTLDWLNLWQDNADNDHWQENEFSATYWDNFPQP
jgi:hypothetical protein